MSAPMKYTFIGSELAIEEYISESMETAFNHFKRGPGLVCLPVRAKNGHLRIAFEKAIYSRGIPLLQMTLRKRVRVFSVMERSHRVVINICLEEDKAAMEVLTEFTRGLGAGIHEGVVDADKPADLEKFLAVSGR